jgi:hypothetical protein
LTAGVTLRDIHGPPLVGWQRSMVTDACFRMFSEGNENGFIGAARPVSGVHGGTAVGRAIGIREGD